MKQFPKNTASSLGIIGFLLLLAACTTSKIRELSSDIPEESSQTLELEEPEEVAEEPEIEIPENMELKQEFIQEIKERLTATDQQIEEMKPILLLNIVKQMEVMKKYGSSY